MSAKLGAGRLVATVNGEEREYELSPALVRACLAAIDDYETKRKARRSRVKASRPLSRNQALKAMDLHDDGLSYASIAGRFGCSELSVRTAIDRVRGGRYDDDLV